MTEERYDHAAYRREVEAEKAREEQQRRENAGKAVARAAWLRDGGSASDFEAQWPRIRDERRRRRILADDEEAHLAQRNAGISRI